MSLPLQNSVFLVLLLCFATSASAQSPSTLPTHQHPPIPSTDNEQFVAYWTSETGWMSELQLRNNLVGQDLTVTPALRLSDGEETVLAPITIKPHEVKSIDLNAAILGAAAPQLIGAYGSVVLRYHSFHAGNLYAAVMVHNIGHPFVFHIDAIGQTPFLETASREGVWWLPKETTTDYLVLTNQSNETIPVGVSLYGANGKEAKQKPLVLGPRETSRYSIRKLVQAAGFAGSYGGIRVSTNAHAGSLDTLHVFFDEKAGFSAVLKMFDHNPNTTLEERDFAHTSLWTTRAPMLALSNPDPALVFPPGTVLRPQLFLRNTTNKFADVALRFGKLPGPSLRLSPYETRRIDVAAFEDGTTLPKKANWTTVTLTTKGLPNEIMAIASSYDDTLRYGAQTPFSDQLSFQWEGGMWEYDAQHDSIMTAGNGGTKPTQVAFTIFYNQGTEKYELEQTLQPDEQMSIDVGKLIREHVPDKNGKTLPADLASGSYEFRDLTDHAIGSLFEGKVIYDKTYGHAAYGCALCCALNNPAFDYNPINVPNRSTAQDYVYAVRSCDGAYVDVTSSFNGGWSTANKSIATVNSVGTYTGVSAGTTTTTAIGYLTGMLAPPYCPAKQKTASGSADVWQGVLTASDNFAGRSTTRFGIAEVINLSFNAPVSAAAIGGLQWSIVSGGGSLVNAGTAGTATYTGPANQATVVLRLAVVSGASQGGQQGYQDFTISFIPPNGGLESSFTNIRHRQGYESVGFEAHIFLQPTDVSFANLQFAEGTDSAIASGFFASVNGQVHPPSNPPLAIGPCSSVIGCQVHGLDQIDSGDNPPPFSVGDFLWQIPWQYRTSTGTLTNFTTANHHETADATGRGTIEKAGAGPFAKNASDPTTTY